MNLWRGWSVPFRSQPVWICDLCSTNLFCPVFEPRLNCEFAMDSVKDTLYNPVLPRFTSLPHCSYFTRLHCPDHTGWTVLHKPTAGIASPFAAQIYSSYQIPSSCRLKVILLSSLMRLTLISIHLQVRSTLISSSDLWVRQLDHRRWDCHPNRPSLANNQSGARARQIQLV